MIRVTIPERFKIPVILLRQDPGSYVDGIWVAGFEESTDITVSWQALQSSEYRLLPEGESPINVFQVYWNGRFQIGADGIQPSDHIMKGGIRYKMLLPNDWIESGYTTALFKEFRP